MAWHLQQDGPLIAPGQLHPGLDDRRAGAAHVIPWDDRYLMTYWGTDRDGMNHILAATSSPDAPNDWTPWGRPWISAQPETEHNAVGPSFPFLLPMTASHWLLYFTAWGRRRSDGTLANSTWVASTHDAGTSWRIHDDGPVIPLDRPYDREATGSLWIMRERDLLRMYYTAIASYGPKPKGVATGHGDRIPSIGIAYAESRDGLTWEKPMDDWIVRPRGFGVEPFEYICSKPCVVHSGDGYTLWVNTFGTAYRVHRLTSHDGLHWTWAPRIGPDGELGAGQPGMFDDIQRSYPTIIATDDGLRCWYTGNGFGTTGMGYAWEPTAASSDEA